MGLGALVVVFLVVRRVAGKLEHTREKDGVLGSVARESDRVKFVVRPRGPHGT